MHEQRNSFHLGSSLILASLLIIIIETNCEQPLQSAGVTSYNCSSENGIAEVHLSLQSDDLAVKFHLFCFVASGVIEFGSPWHNPSCLNVSGFASAVKLWVVNDEHREPTFFCQSNSLLDVKIEFLDAVGSSRYADNLWQSQRWYDIKSNSTTHKVVLSYQEGVSTRFTVTGLYENELGQLQPWTDTPISILTLFYGRQDAVIFRPDERVPLNFYATEDVVLIPCLTHPSIESDPFVYQMMAEDDWQCVHNALNVTYDPLRGIYLNVSQRPDYATSLFRCCSTEVCSKTNCTLFFIKDPEDIEASPRMPVSGDPLRLFATQEDNSIPFVLECSFWGRVQLRGALSWPSSPDRPPEYIMSGNYTVQQTRSGSKPRFIASYKVTLHLFEWLWVECVDEPTQDVLYAWNVTTHDAGGAGPDSSPSDPTYLTLLQLSEKEAEVPTMRCRSDRYDNVQLQVIRCDKPEQCRLLEWCFDSDADGCVKRIVTNGTDECLDLESRSCQDLPVPQPGGHFRCTAGGHSYTQLRWLGLGGKQSYLYKEDTDLSNASLIHEIIRVNNTARPEPFYTKLPYKFSIHMHSFFLEAHGRIFFGFSNQSEPQQAESSDSFTEPTETKPLRQETKVTFPSSAVNRLIVNAPKRGQLNKWLTVTMHDLHVEDSIEPQILNDKTTFYFADDGEQKTITCNVSGLPLPKILWTKWGLNGIELVIGPTLQLGMQAVNGSTLRWERFTKEYEGTYECAADNGIGDAGGVTMNFTASLPIEGGGGDDGGAAVFVWIGVGGAAGAILLIVGPVGFLVRRIFRKPVLDKETIELFRYGVQEDAETEDGAAENLPAVSTISDEGDQPPKTARPSEPPTTPTCNWLTRVDRKPFDKKFEISRWKFKIDKKRPLGKGEFGVVYAGTVNLPGQDSPVDVAIKVNKKDCPEASLAGLLKEIKYMTYLQHENIVSLIGANTAQAEYGQLYILMELCEEGSLEQFFERKHCDYLEANSEPAVKQTPVASHYSIIEAKTFGFRELVRWCSEVAAGMEFLSSKGIVHRDLAARNVLLTTAPAWKAKISDFGLSRQLYGSPAYQQKSREMRLPIRWMAPECFTGTFSTNSDVWAFGVVACEIFSLGSLPYAGTEFSDAGQFHQLLTAGLRIKERGKATEEIFAKVSECWNETPSQRPSFTHLKDFFKGQLNHIGTGP